MMSFSRKIIDDFPYNPSIFSRYFHDVHIQAKLDNVYKNQGTPDFVNVNSYVYYVVEIITADACEISAQLKSANIEAPIGSIRSNIVTNNPNGPTGLEYVNVNDFVQIYPNPVKDELHIESGNLTITKIEILDITGKVVEKSNIVSALPRGIYFVKLETDKGIVTQKFIKE